MFNGMLRPTLKRNVTFIVPIGAFCINSFKRAMSRFDPLWLPIPYLTPKRGYKPP